MEDVSRILQSVWNVIRVDSWYLLEHHRWHTFSSKTSPKVSAILSMNNPVWLLSHNPQAWENLKLPILQDLGLTSKQPLASTCLSSPSSMQVMIETTDPCGVNITPMFLMTLKSHTCSQHITDHDNAAFTGDRDKIRCHFRRLRLALGNLHWSTWLISALSGLSGSWTLNTHKHLSRPYSLHVG